jgi:Tfp pilus assembly protein PilF
VEGKELFDSYKSSSIGFSVLKKEDVEEAEIYQKNMSDLFKDNPESSSYHFIMGSYYMKKGLLEDAIREFEMILGMNPDSPVSHEILGKLYQEVGQKDRAIAELQKALELSKK